MKTLNKNFLQLIGKRIINRAEKLGIKLSELGITPSKKKKIEKGEYNFTFQQIKEIAERLYIDPIRLLSKDYKDLTIHFRSISKLELETIKKIEEIVHILISKNLIQETSFIDFMEDYIDLSKNFKFDNLSIGITIANKVRKHYKLKIEPVNLFKFCFNYKFYPLIVNKNVDFEGALLIVGNYVIALIKESHIPRMHFTLAHELGHFFMHKNLGIKLDKKISLSDKSPEEITANYFASEFILPSKLVMKTSNLDTLEKYCISKEALSIAFERNKVRNASLDLFTPHCANNWQYVSPYSLNNIIYNNIKLFGNALQETIKTLLCRQENI